MQSLRLGQLAAAALIAMVAGATQAAAPSPHVPAAVGAHGLHIPHRQRVDADSATAAPVHNLRLVKKPRIKSQIWA